MALNIFNIETEGDKCVICQELLNKYQIYSLPECKHAFHTQCIVTWFRHRPSSENQDGPDGKCPCCGNRGINNKNKPKKQFTRYGRYGWRHKRGELFNDKKKLLYNL